MTGGEDLRHFNIYSIVSQLYQPSCNIPDFLFSIQCSQRSAVMSDERHDHEHGIASGVDPLSHESQIRHRAL